MTLEELKDVCNDYQLIATYIHENRKNHFPHHCIVKVHNFRYQGYGVNVLDGDCPVDKLAIELENGNVWWYPIVDCQPETDSNLYPDWIKKIHHKL